MHHLQLLESFVKPAPVPHLPAFRIAEEPRGWRLFDGDSPIAFFSRPELNSLDIWRFSPHEPPVTVHEAEPRHVFDLYTLHASTISFPYTSGRDLIAGCSDLAAAREWTWVEASGPRLHARLRATFADGQRIEYNLRVTYDPAWGRYRYHLDSDCWKREPTGFEPLNMMIAGALVSRPEDVRWTHSIWADPFGQLRRFVHSNALFMATDFAPATWRTRNAPDVGAWIAYGAHPSYNPCLLIHQASPSVHFATCSQLFDEHVIWNNAGFDDLDQGYFHFRLRTEFVNLAPALAKSLLDRAIDPPKPATWRNQAVALPLYFDRTNDLSTPVDPWLPEECPLLIVPDPRTQPGIRWDQDCGHSGRHSIRLQGRTINDRTLLFPTGAVCNVEMDSRYRFSAWVKTDQVERFARLDLYSYEYTYQNILDFASSAKLSGSQGWTQLSVELDTGDEVYVMPQLFLYGPGTAWFTDLRLEKIG